MPETRNPAEVRGDIQRGRTGDKRPGFDPAAAPLETDAEAGSSGLSPEEATIAAESAAAGKPQSRSQTYGSALRQEDSPVRPHHHPKRTMIYLVLAGVALVLLILAFTSFF